VAEARQDDASGSSSGGASQDKADLRARVLAARSGLAADRPREAGRLIRDALLSFPPLQMAGTVAAYYSSGPEPDTRGLLFALWKRGTYVLLPILRPDGDLDWASYEGPDSLVPGPTWSWCPPWPSTTPGTASDAAVAATTAPWPGSGR
jgi:5-formyltetrahydrofolate cyclo-ligase